MGHSNRKKRFIAASFILSKDGRFDWNAVADKLGISHDEARDTSLALPREGVLTGIGFQSSEALFTYEGRDLARDYIDEGFGEGLNP